jgi:hypothetical protein
VYVSLTVQDTQNPLLRLRGVHQYVQGVVANDRRERGGSQKHEQRQVHYVWYTMFDVWYTMFGPALVLCLCL